MLPKRWSFRTNSIKTTHSYRFVTNEKKRDYLRHNAQKISALFVHMLQKK